MKTPIRGVVWLDRDGTIVDDPGYLRDPGDVRLLPGAARAVARLNAAGATVILVTNQSGIARGLLDEVAFRAVQDEVARQLAAERAHLDDIRFCPHLPSRLLDADTPPCACRKPRPGMVEEARRDHAIGDEVPQVVVGDKIADLDLGRAVRALRVLVLTGEGRSTRDQLVGAGELRSRADQVADDLDAAVPWILDQLGLADPPPNC